MVWYLGAMPRDGTATRERILEAAQKLVLDQGFAATSVDEVIAAARTTKGGFFHHFPTKQALAAALVERFASDDIQLLDDLLSRAERLTSDPLQQLLLFVGLYEEAADELSGDDPGCLYASLCYERELMDDVVRRTISGAIVRWRQRIREKLDHVVEVYPPRLPVDLDSLADQAVALAEGAYVISRALEERHVLREQLRHLRTYLELLFTPLPAAAASG